jgi:hypothetical protein
MSPTGALLVHHGVVTAVLIVLCLLFVARVVGQLLVVLFKPRWLPPMEAWMSGVMPYRWLLPSQLAIIALQMFMIRQVLDGAPAHRALIIGIYIFASIYAAAMVVRFFVKRNPLIPILFHWVLAAFLFTYAAARGAS